MASSSFHLAVTVAFFIGLCRVAVANDDQDGMSHPLPAADQSRPSPLQRSPSPIYLPLRPETPVRSGPSVTASIVFTISATAKPFPALGMVFDGDPRAFRSAKEELALARSWIKLRLPNGATGFVSLADLVTPQQQAARAASGKKVGLFEADVATAKAVKGSDIPSGIYTHGGSCDAPQAADDDVSDFLRTKVLIWEDGTKMHFVQVLRPDDPTVYDIQNDKQVRELQGFGYVPMRTYRSVKDAALMGYKDKLLWFTTDGNQFDSYLACNEGAYAAVTSMLRSYANQRPPESR